jgi:hypothetical protein
MLSHNRPISVPSSVPVTYSELFFLKSTFILSFQLLPSLQPGQSPRNFLKVCISYLPHTNRMSNTSPNILSCINYHVAHYAKTPLPFLSLFSPGVFPPILPSNEETTLHRKTQLAKQPLPTVTLQRSTPVFHTWEVPRSATFLEKFRCLPSDLPSKLWGW